MAKDEINVPIALSAFRDKISTICFTTNIYASSSYSSSTSSRVVSTYLNNNLTSSVIFKGI